MAADEFASLNLATLSRAETGFTLAPPIFTLGIPPVAVLRRVVAGL
jgi:hypothetical protein